MKTSKKASENFKCKISASILSANFIDLHNIIPRLEKHIDSLHLDVMDGHFVDNLTFGPKIISDIRSITKLPFNTHLMISNPEKFIEQYANAGLGNITFHLEAAEDANSVINQIYKVGCTAGIAIRPNTSHTLLEPFLPNIEKVLIMTVNPGFGGQKFIANMAKKIEAVAKMRKRLNCNFLISLDGGINPKALAELKGLEFDEVIVGSYLFNGSLQENVDNLINVLATGNF